MSRNGSLASLLGGERIFFHFSPIFHQQYRPASALLIAFLVPMQREQSSMPPFLSKWHSRARARAPESVQRPVLCILCRSCESGHGQQSLVDSHYHFLSDTSSVLETVIHATRSVPEEMLLRSNNQSLNHMALLQLYACVCMTSYTAEC